MLIIVNSFTFIALFLATNTFNNKHSKGGGVFIDNPVVSDSLFLNFSNTHYPDLGKTETRDRSIRQRLTFHLTPPFLTNKNMSRY